MADIRIKDLANTAVSVPADAYEVIDSASGGTEKISRDNKRLDMAAAFAADPATYNLAPLAGGAVAVDKGGTGSTTAAGARTNLDVPSNAEVASDITDAIGGVGSKLNGPALFFNGASSVVTVAHDAKQHFNNGSDDLPFSLEFWVNTDFSVAGGLIGKYQAGATEFVAWVTGNGLRFGLSDGTDEPYIQTASLTDYSNKWTHFAITSSGSGPNSANDFPAAIDSISVFVNGKDITSGATKQNEAAYGGLNNSSAAITLMSFAASNFKKGEIRSVKLYNRELTAAEVAQLALGTDLGYSDEWAGTQVYTGDSSTFASSLGNWAEEGATSITVAQSAGEMVITNTAASSGTRGANNTTDTLTEGKRYRLRFQSRASSGTGQQIAIRTFNSSPTSWVNVVSGSGSAGTVGTQNIYTFTPTASVETHTIEFALAGGATDSLLINLNNTGAGEVYNFDNITLTQVGVLADFRAENYDESTGKLYDESDNAYVGVGTSVALTGRAYPVYETDVWTPSITFGGGSTGITYSAQEGYYTRIGNTVFVSGVVTLSAVGSSTGTARIAGLPFISRNMTTTSFTVSSVAAFDMAGLTSMITALIEDNQPDAILYDGGATGAVAVDHSNFTATSSIRFSATYQIQ